MHLEALPEKNKSLWQKLSLFPNFYLAGGTALALQIGHRISVDFDLFSDKVLSSSLLSQLEQIFQNAKLEPLVNNQQELTVLVDQVKLTFLHYPFLIINPLIHEHGLSLLDIPELAATKAYTIGRRGSFKDYVDLYFVLSENHTDLANIISVAERKYQTAFNSRIFLEQLVYLDDITDTAIQFIKPAVSKQDLQTFFASQVKNIKL